MVARAGGTDAAGEGRGATRRSTGRRGGAGPPGAHGGGSRAQEGRRGGEEGGEKEERGLTLGSKIRR
jgi:hypothetical protein